MKRFRKQDAIEFVGKIDFTFAKRVKKSAILEILIIEENILLKERTKV